MYSGTRYDACAMDTLSHCYRRSIAAMAARMLAALPVVAVAAWSGNAALLRLQHQSSAPLEFVAGSMDDAIMESLETGDVIFFSRRLAALQPLAAVHTAALRRQLNPRFDHCGWVFVDRLGRHFVVEETLGRVHCRPYAARVLSSEASEIAVLRLKAPRPKALQDAALAFVTANAGRASRSSLKQFVGALIDPNKLLAPVNKDQDDEQADEQEEREVAFPSAGMSIVATAMRTDGQRVC